MKLIILGMMIVFSLSIQAKPLSKLNQLSWKHRIILVWQTPDSNQYKTLFDQYHAQLIERDIIWFIINGDKILTNYSGEMSNELLSNVRRDYPVTPSTTLLIGKDGGVKSSQEQPVLDEIFAEIDLMPMRKMEVKRKNNLR